VTENDARLELYSRDGIFMIRANGLELMSGFCHDSAKALGQLAAQLAPAREPRILIGGLGLFLTLRTGGFVGIWLMFLAFMLWQSARAALAGTATVSRVSGVRVADVMDHEPVVLRGTTTVERAYDEYFLRYQSDWLPVVDGDGRFIGIARRIRADELVRAGEGAATVGSILEPGSERLAIGQDRPLTEVLALDSLGRLGAVIATDADDTLTGILTLEQVRRALQTLTPNPATR
jgi:CBS domain-containing protein